MTVNLELNIAASFEGGPLGPKDAIFVEIQRFGPDGVLVGRQKIPARIVGVSLADDLSDAVSLADDAIRDNKEA